MFGFKGFSAVWSLLGNIQTDVNEIEDVMPHINFTHELQINVIMPVVGRRFLVGEQMENGRKRLTQPF